MVVGGGTIACAPNPMIILKARADNLNCARVFVYLSLLQPAPTSPTSSSESRDQILREQLLDSSGRSLSWPQELLMLRILHRHKAFAAQMVRYGSICHSGLHFLVDS